MHGIGETLGIDSHSTVAEILPGLFCEKISTKLLILFKKQVGSYHCIEKEH